MYHQAFNMSLDHISESQHSFEQLHANNLQFDMVEFLDFPNH